MSKHITDPANDNYTFGQSFNYETWPIDTVITLCNVPWNNDYRDVVKFPNRQKLNEYIDTLETVNERLNYVSNVQPNVPIRINTPVNAATRYNYLRASNPLGPIPGNVAKDYYYFITNVVEIAPETTEITLQLDVFQTFMYDVTLGNCYIERGHIGIANANAFSSYGRDYLTIPEGLDVGSDYVNVVKAFKQIMGTSTDTADDEPDNESNVLVLSTIELFPASAGTITDPQISLPRPGTIQNISAGVGVWLFEDARDFSNYIESVKNTPWIAQGIISVTLVPHIRRYHPAAVFQERGNASSDLTSIKVISNTVSFMYPKQHDLKPNWRESEDVLNYIPERYRHLKKLLVFPYTVIELTTHTGTPIVLKPEAWANADLRVTEIATMSPNSQRMSFHPYKYNALEDSEDEFFFADQLVDDQGDWLDVATYITDFPKIAVMTNNGILYLANNANQIAFSQRSADWSQQVALRGNQVAYDQASAAVRMAEDVNANNINRDRAQTALGNQLMSDTYLTNAIGGLVGGMASGGMGGAVAGPGGAALGAGMAGVGSTISGVVSAMNTNLQINANNQGYGIRAGNAMANLGAQVNNANYVRDTNKALADWAARGDYENTIAGINARVQDAQMIPPSTVGQMGGSTTNLIHRNMRIVARIKMIDRAAIARVGEYWLRYGYAVRRFGRIPESLMAMTKFTYWKLAETYITGAPMPEGYKQAIRGIFEKGVTVWANPNDVGNIDLADNEAIEGIAY